MVVVEAPLVDEAVMVVVVVASIGAATAVGLTILRVEAIEEATEDVQGDMHHIEI